MAAPAPTTGPGRPARRLRGAALACGTTLALTAGALAGAAPAVAQTSATSATANTVSTSTAGAASASSLRITVNLPGQLSAAFGGSTISLDVDPVAGSVRAVPGSAPEAQAVAAILAGSIGSQAQSFGAAQAKLPSPLTAQGSPFAQVNSGIAGSPLADFLKVSLASSSATVTATPTGTSAAGTQLALGLPTLLGPVLLQGVTQIQAAVNQLLAAAAAPLNQTTTQLCAGLSQVTGPLAGVGGSIPVLGGVLTLPAQLTNPQAGVLCTLGTSLQTLVKDLSTSLTSLTGPGGVLNTGVLTTSQTLTTTATGATATATSQVAGLTVLGQDPFGQGTVLRTTSTASVGGSSGPVATVDKTAVTASTKANLLSVSTDLSKLTGSVAGADLTAISPLLTQLQTVLTALSGIALTAGPLDPATGTLTACPAAAPATLSGTFKSPDGTCSAAAALGYGISLTLPAALAGPLGVTGPLLSVSFAPSAAVVRAATSTSNQTPGQPPEQSRLASTGLPVSAAAGGLLLVALGAVMRRRRPAG